MNGDAVESVRDRRAGRTSCLVVGPEHEVVDDKLGAPLEEICQRGAAFIGLESIRLVDATPGQFLPPLHQFVAAPLQLLFRLEQPEPRGKPFFTCSGLVLGHCSSPLGFLAWSEPTTRTVTTAPAQSRTEVRNVGERIVQSTMTAAF